MIKKTIHVITEMLNQGFENFWFDVDGTIIDSEMNLTSLGRAVAHYCRVTGKKVNIFTYGGWTHESLAEYGIYANEIKTVGKAMIEGWIDDEGRKLVPIDGTGAILIDNEDHPNSKVIPA